jgi:hypothetical protein
MECVIEGGWADVAVSRFGATPSTKVRIAGIVHPPASGVHRVPKKLGLGLQPIPALEKVTELSVFALGEGPAKSRISASRSSGKDAKICKTVTLNRRAHELL